MRHHHRVGFLKYIGMLLSRAAHKSVLLTDRLTILIVPFATLVLWAAGAKMTDSIQETLLLGVAMTVVAVVALRLVAASYFVWKEDQEQKRELESLLAAPERDGEIEMKRYTLELRKQLSGKIGQLATFACYPAPVVALYREADSRIAELIAEVDTLINQLSYDFPVRIACLKLRDYCLKLIHENETPGEHFWEQRRITFRLLHKEDWVADFLSLIELEILLEDEAGQPPRAAPESEAIEELKAMIRELGDKYHSREVREHLRGSLRDRTRSGPRLRQSPEGTESGIRR